MDSEKICRTWSTALRWPCVFVDSWEVADDIGYALASRIVSFFCVKPVNASFTGSRMKRTGLWILHCLQLLIFHTFSAVFLCSQRSIYFMCKFTFNVNTCSNGLPQRSIYFMSKFTWTWITWTWIHVNTCPTPPHANTTPRPSKGRGPTSSSGLHWFINIYKPTNKTGVYHLVYPLVN